MLFQTFSGGNCTGQNVHCAHCLKLNDFKVLKDAVWSNEKSQSVFMFELEQQVLPNIKKHWVRRLNGKQNAKSTYAKYGDNEMVISWTISLKMDAGWLSCHAKPPMLQYF